MDADLVILGGGPAGYSAALEAARFKAKVVIVERARMGGTCLNFGCIPTKTLLAAAELRARALRMRGLGLSSAPLEAGALNARKREVVETLRSQLESLLKASSVTVIKGEGELSVPGEVNVRKADGSMETVRARGTIIATGSAVRPLPGVVRVPGRVMDSNDMLSADSWPSSLAIIGGGVIGAEFASLFSLLGVKVTLLEALPRLLAGEDADLGKRLARSLTAGGVEIRLGAKIESLGEEGGGVAITTASKDCLRSAAALVCVGRAPSTAGVDLHALGLKTANGAVTVDEGMRTSVPGIFAAGDVTGGPQLAHFAVAQGRKAALTFLELPERVDLDTVPRCVYSVPEAAAVGLSEESAREGNLKYRKAVLVWRGLSRAQCMNETEGMTKVIAEEGSGKILGVHIFGHGASELISEACLAMRSGLTVSDVAGTLHPHPTLSESFAEACEQLAR